MEAAAHDVVRERRLYPLKSDGLDGHALAVVNEGRGRLKKALKERDSKRAQAELEQMDERIAQLSDLGKATAQLEKALCFAIEADGAPNLCALTDELESLVRTDGLKRLVGDTPSLPQETLSPADRRRAIRMAVKAWLLKVDPIRVLTGAAAVAWQAAHFVDPETLTGPDPATVELVRWAKAHDYSFVKLGRDMADQEVPDKPGHRRTPSLDVAADATAAEAHKAETAAEWEGRIKKWSQRAPKGDKAGS